MNQFLLGSIAIGSFVIGLFFLRYWRSTGDRFFLYLMLSFWIETINRVAIAWTKALSEDAPVFYWVRLVSYVMILLAIWEKNRSRSD